MEKHDNRFYIKASFCINKYRNWERCESLSFRLTNVMFYLRYANENYTQN